VGRRPEAGVRPTVSRDCSRWYPRRYTIDGKWDFIIPTGSANLRVLPGPVRCKRPASGPVRRWTLPTRPPSFRVGGSAPRGDAAISTDETRINDRIRARQVRLIGSDGTQFGVKTLPEALQIAREQGLDLVEVAAAADPPVCKIMDHGKYKYEQDQRRKESKRKASNVVIKEMKFRPKIDGHDYTTKMKHVERFLEEGSKVKLTIMFRGREMAHPELGRRILERVAEQVGELAIIESSPKLDGRNMTMVLNPTRRPKGKGQGATKGAPKSGGHGSGEPESGEPGSPEPEVAEPVAVEAVGADATA
jgi:translation initiation factor IF-3